MWVRSPLPCFDAASLSPLLTLQIIAYYYVEYLTTHTMEINSMNVLVHCVMKLHFGPAKSAKQFEVPGIAYIKGGLICIVTHQGVN